MNTFPLIRVKWSNEHIMAAVFGVLILYMIPSWVYNISEILSFLIILLLSLIIDVIINIIRYKRPICAVSAAVTAGIFYILTPGVPLVGQILGITVAMLLGKHIWGGTGKNPVNPALIGIIFISFFFTVNELAFNFTFLLIPASILSLTFARFRPYATLGLITGITAALLLKHELSVETFITYGVIFWACIVFTDPVTITANPVIGVGGGILTGFLALWFSGSIFMIAICILLFNILSITLTRFIKNTKKTTFRNTRINKIIPLDGNNISFYNLTEDVNSEVEDFSLLSREEILSRIEVNDVFGFGGAAFSTIKKIVTLIESEESQKYLIINGVECDPGLIHDHWLMKNYMKEISIGINILKKCIDFESVAFAVKESTDIICSSNAKIAKVPNYYPIGAEKILIRQVLGKALSKEEIPAKKGILVLNVQTIYSIFEAICRNKKADSKFITVVDLKNKYGYVAKVKIGTNIQNAIDILGIKDENIFWGGGAMKCQTNAEDKVIDKTVNFIAAGGAPRYKESPLCSRCGFCKDNCPAGIPVYKISELAYNRKWEEVKKYEPEKCIQCGTCSWVCLSGRNLAAQMKIAMTVKNEVND